MKHSKNQSLLFELNQPPAVSPKTEPPKRLGEEAWQERFAHLVIRASAGTGKTYRLSNRFLQLLAEGVAADDILASTFTRKAAGEILDRILTRLAKAALTEENCRELAQQLEHPELTREHCLEMLHQVVRSLHRMRVSTLDSFFVQVARSFSLELGLPPGWQICDELQDEQLRDEAIENVLHRHSVEELRNLVHLLTKGEAQRGIGKLVRDTVRELYALYQATEREAWYRLPEYPRLTLVELAETMQALSEFPLENAQLAKARDQDYERALSGSWDEFLAKGLASKVLRDELVYSRKPIPEGLADIYRKLIRHARAELVDVLARQTDGAYQLLEKFDHEYRQLKRQRRSMRFDDVTRQLAVALSGRMPQDPTARSAAAVLADLQRLTFRLDGRIDHLLLDEFQDTAPPQWLVLRPFAEAVTRATDRRSFFCVGDVKQAIYGWRGGAAEIFDALDQNLCGLKQELLSESYRSSQVIIDVVNQVFHGMVRHPKLGRTEEAVRAWSEAFPVHATAKRLPGHACLMTSSGQSAESALISAADHIARLISEKPDLDVGVLVRKNDAVGRMIYELRQRGVPASEEGGNPLTDAASVQLILSVLKLTDHPGDRVAWFHVLNSPLAETVGAQEDGSASGVAEVVRKALHQDGYGRLLRRWAAALESSCDARERSRLEQLVELAYAYQPPPALRTSDFIRYVQKQKVADPTTATVRVMTVHQAKGLQFDLVVLPQLTEKLVGQPDQFVARRDATTGTVDFVCRYANENVRELLPEEVQQMFEATVARDVSESLCVLYVALTRPVHALHMFIPASAANESSLPCSYAGLLRAALTDGNQLDADTKIFETGDPNWLQKIEPGPQDAVLVGSDASDEPPRIVLASPPGGRQRGLQRTSPSGLEGGRRIRVTDLLRSGDDRALERGTLIHAWFEQIEWLGNEPLDEAQLRRIADQVLETHLGPDAFQARLQEFSAMLQLPAVRQLLCLESYRQGLPFAAKVSKELQGSNVELAVYRERQFAVRDAQQLITGNVDRLVVFSRDGASCAADIIDFKTDQLPPDDAKALKQRVEYYRPQIEAYRQVVGRVLKLDSRRIAARLLFVSAGCVCDV